MGVLFGVTIRAAMRLIAETKVSHLALGVWDLL